MYKEELTVCHPEEDTHQDWELLLPMTPEQERHWAQLDFALSTRGLYGLPEHLEEEQKEI